MANSLQLSKHAPENNELSNFEKEQKIIDRAPFVKLKIRDAKILDSIEGREICGKCYKSRKFFCYTCCTPVIDKQYIPRVKLPIRIDIIKHAREIDGKSTAIHAAVIAPEDVRIYTYPEFPEISKDEKVVLIFPSKTASNIEDLFVKEVECGGQLIQEMIKNEFPITRAIFIDSTWHQTKSIYKDQRLRGRYITTNRSAYEYMYKYKQKVKHLEHNQANENLMSLDLRCVVLKSRISQFWRHQKSSPRWYLATIEAIHQFLVELHTNAFGAVQNYTDRSSGETKNPEENEAGDPPEAGTITFNSMNKEYSGQYDDLLFFFKYMYEKIHSMYDHEKLWAYKRPLI